MKVEISYSGKAGDPTTEYGYGGACTVKVDGVEIADGCDYSECPEDANLGLGLQFVYGLPGVLKKAHEAGVAGEPFEMTEIQYADG